MRRALRSLPTTVAVTLTVAVGIACWTAAAAHAHGIVRDSWPRPGETVSGTVDEVTLHFLDPVLPTPSITVTGPDGASVPGLGPTVLSEGDRTATVSFDPLDAPGDHRVDYRFVAGDGHPGQDAFRFTYDADADGDGDGDGDGTTSVLVAGAAGLVVLGLAARWWWRGRRAASGGG